MDAAAGARWLRCGGIFGGAGGGAGASAAAKTSGLWATTQGPAAEALLEGAEYDAETEDGAEASEEAVAAAARVWPPRPSNWGDMSRRQRQIGNSELEDPDETRVMEAHEIHGDQLELHRRESRFSR